MLLTNLSPASAGLLYSGPSGARGKPARRAALLNRQPSRGRALRFASSAIVGSATSCYPQGGGLLIGFQRDLLRQHDVVHRQIALRREASEGNTVTALVELLDVQLCMAMDVITPPVGTMGVGLSARRMQP